MFWPWLNAIAGLTVALVLTYRLARVPEILTQMERTGMGLIGGGMVLTIGPILSTPPTPYEDWSAALIRVGCAVFFIGQLLRHWQLNAAATRQARQHLKAKK